MVQAQRTEGNRSGLNSVWVFCCFRRWNRYISDWKGKGVHGWGVSLGSCLTLCYSSKPRPETFGTKRPTSHRKGMVRLQIEQ